MDEHHLLNIATSYLKSAVFPESAEIDRSPQALQNALNGLGELGLLALQVPSVWGGLAASAETYYNFQQLVARYSGALAFLQTQHQSAAGMLVRSQNQSLQQEYLPHLSNGNILLGVGFSHLRRRGEAIVKATPVDDGYRLNGTVPWITGFGIFQEFIAAATLSDDRAVFGLVPFVNSDRDAGKITFSEVLPLAAMTSTNTVTARLDNWLLKCDRLVSIKPPSWIHDNDKQNVLKATALALGCALASLDVIQATYSNKQLAFIHLALEKLHLELSQCRAAIDKAANESYQTKLKLRAWAIDLAVRCAHCAIAVSSGAANHNHHPAQRIYREALVYTVSGQSTDLMAATLNRLIDSK
ncbi:acyl-CoA dehydrogenase family protein [Aliterella atlantica]|uniref:Acyl-CoA dehydrogenase n=1 Tax=Aliterella atlantica CENA595 TaxID=1618023 RepID=A0A0D8ZVT0_9CYAN|nr:acyl-CoA dehydrogenase family protein [Aliterella atlantica]KJH72497.1 acyl-CoA dehydrogenase [Aliterella atlantica CENA595]